MIDAREARSDRRFYGTNAFNGAIGNWDVSNVDDMRSMFYGVTAFNTDLSSWDVSSITDQQGMILMFYGASSYDQDLGWCVHEDVDLSGVFDGAPCGADAPPCGVSQGSACAR